MVLQRSRLVGISVIMAALLVLVLGASRGLAQDATPAAEDAPAATGMGLNGGASHPGHIHEGTCDTLNPQPLIPLADATVPSGDEGDDADMASPAAMATPMGGMAGMMGAADAIEVAVSVTTVDASLTDIMTMADHAVNFLESMENIDVYVACGSIGGTVDADGNLFIGLAERNDSGVSGIAWLLANDDGTTTVSVFLAAGLSDGGADEGMATPEADDDDVDASPAA